MDTRLHIVLFGPPGAGKSTQSQLLTRRVPLVALSTGKMLREEVAKGSELGQRVQQLLAQGELVPDEIMIKAIRNWLEALPPEKGFLLDGFPRTPEQAEALDQMLTELGRPLTGVINLNLTVSEAIHRLGGRRICHVNGSSEEIIHIDDEIAVEACIKRGGLLVQRPDDLPNVIVRRLAVYESETAPLLYYYEPRGLMHTISASGSPEEVVQRISLILTGQPQSKRA
jgi:adenylate kinase